MPSVGRHFPTLQAFREEMLAFRVFEGTPRKARPIRGGEMERTTKGSIEAEVANAIVRFQREQHGRGASDVRAHLVGDLLIVRSGGIFTPTEAHLAASEEGRRLIKSARRELRSIHRDEAEALVARIVAAPVVRSYYDLDVTAAEQVEMYILEVDVEKRLLRQDVDRLTYHGPRRSG
ncbi:MAG: DUF2294 domain-containing protein [Capsulimonadales bacterium]|nr:DUF2294 domain-containing protein [Capsulimonadales bacterium]